MDQIAAYLPHINASLNFIATVLLTIAFIAVKKGNHKLHAQAMITAFGVSCVFLICYLTRYYLEGNKKFPSEDYATYFMVGYYVLLASHVLLAATVPYFSMRAIYLGWKGELKKHKSFAKWAFPIWYYVSVTGVLVYFCLYWWFPPIAK